MVAPPQPVEDRTLLGSPVVIGAPLAAAGARIAALAPAHVYAIVTDDRIARLPYLAQVTDAVRSAAPRGRVITHQVPEGEGSKTRGQWAALSDWLLAQGCGRDTTLIALGGGVVGDLTGFVAATFMRGIAFVQLPTTLLAMVDAALGGKTGVDTPAGKNLIGAFHRPVLVHIDPSVLRTLAPAQVRAGMAEVLKHGAIADATYFHAAAKQAATLHTGAVDPAAWWSSPAARDLVARSVEIKSDIVASDEREHGPREALNFGHTVGHAIEAAAQYELLHGEAIAIGMVVEALVGEAMELTAAGTASTLADAFRAAGLPTQLPSGLTPARVVAATRADKKARAGQTRCAIPQSLGVLRPREGRWSVGVTPRALETALSATNGEGRRGER